MGIKSKTPKKKWLEGRDMPEYSGKSWKELNDLWPAEIRVASDAWKIISVSPVAWEVTRTFMKGFVGGTITWQGFQMLCWIQRCEEAKQGISTEAWAPMKGLNISGGIWYNRKAALTRLGLVENVPIKNIRLYRVTGNGKLVIKYFVEQSEMAHKNLRYWLSLHPPEHADKLTKKLNRYWPGWDQMTI
jgi:hypothetical protein